MSNKPGSASSAQFLIFLGSRSFFTLGVNMQSTLISWFVYQITHDALDLGFTGLAEVIPYVGLLLFGGAWADRFNRKNLMLFSQVGYLFISFGLWFLAFESESGATVSPLLIYCLIFLTGLFRGILSPSQNALLGQLVSKEEVPKASVWNSAVFHLGAVGGPAAGGLLYAYAGGAFSFGVVCCLQLLAVITLIQLRGVKKPEFRHTGESIFNRIGTGLRFVWSHKILFPGMMMDMVAVLFGGAVAVLPLFADQILHTGAEGLGWLRAAPALGSLVMAGILIRFPLGRDAGKWLLICVFLFGLTNLFFALSTQFFLSFAMLFLGGLFDNVSAIIRMTIVQIFTPDDMKGRVSAVNSIFIGSSNELGAFESGLAARYLGLAASVTYGAYITLATVGFTAWKSKELRQLSME
jgi:MFS family permease